MENTAENRTALLARIKKVQDNANELATAHACLQDFQNFAGGLILAVNLSVPLFLVAIALVPESDTARFFGWLATVPYISPLLPSQKPLSDAEIKYVAACLAILCFLTTLIDLLAKPKEQAKVHKEAVDHYTKAKYKLRDLRLFEGIHKSTEEQLVNELHQITTDYLDRSKVPAIPELLFVPLKVWHETKTLLSDLTSTIFKSLSCILNGLASGQLLCKPFRWCKPQK